MTVLKYSKIRSRPTRAIQIFNMLVGMAHRRETITYGGLAERLGYRGAGVFAQTLGLIMAWCADNGLPPLTALVVGSRRGTPGKGLVTPVNLDEDREEVYGMDWYDIVPPTIEDLQALDR